MRHVTSTIVGVSVALRTRVGELLRCSSSVNAVWRSSMEVGVRVEAENPRTGEAHHTNTAYLTMVALDDKGRPAEVADLALAVMENGYVTNQVLGIDGGMHPG